MANACRISIAAAIAMANALVDLIDGGSGAGTLVMYTGTAPAYADSSGAGLTEVATLTFGDPAYAGAAADAVNHWADANLTGGTTISDTSATGNTSAVTCFRVFDSNAAVVLQGTIGTSGADINLNATTIGAGAQVDLTALEARVPYNAA